MNLTEDQKSEIIKVYYRDLCSAYFNTRKNLFDGTVVFIQQTARTCLLLNGGAVGFIIALFPHLFGGRPLDATGMTLFFFAAMCFAIGCICSCLFLMSSYYNFRAHLDQLPRNPAIRDFLVNASEPEAILNLEAVEPTEHRIKGQRQMKASLGSFVIGVFLLALSLIATYFV